MKNENNNLCSTAQFIDKALIAHGNKYDYTLSVYTNSRVKIKIICPNHGVFLQLPNSHKRGRGCPKCAKYGFNKNKSGTLYYLKISHNGQTYYKIGITNKSITERFTKKDLAKIETIKSWKYKIGEEAYTREQEILKLYKSKIYLGPDILSSGNSEIFVENILDIN